MSYEKLLGDLLGFEADTRVELVQVSEPGETPTLELRLQRDGKELGWLTQRRIRLCAGQIGQLRDALNLMDPDGRDAPAPRIHPMRRSDKVISMADLRRSC